jgi:hypothetical protein
LGLSGEGQETGREGNEESHGKHED